MCWSPKCICSQILFQKNPLFRSISSNTASITFAINQFLFPVHPQCESAHIDSSCSKRRGQQIVDNYYYEPMGQCVLSSFDNSDRYAGSCKVHCYASTHCSGTIIPTFLMGRSAIFRAAHQLFPPFCGRIHVGNYSSSFFPKLINYFEFYASSHQVQYGNS